MNQYGQQKDIQAVTLKVRPMKTQMFAVNETVREK
mgnify:CR=1 FL=1